MNKRRKGRTGWRSKSKVEKEQMEYKDKEK
jgi:hypothetical protein